MEMTQAKLDEIVRKHGMWLRNEDGGVRVNLSGANMSDANLRGANLIDADLTGADLLMANLRGANLHDANLSGAFLIGADLSGANLIGADLFGAILRGANLIGTCLDPANKVNGNMQGFPPVPEKPGYVIGYRTRKTTVVGRYLDGRIYSADFFSTADTECHPGLYLWPTLELAKEWDRCAELIIVHAPAKHVHKAGEKWRCRWFEVIGKAE